MHIKFIEAGHGPYGGNWGKFMLGRYARNELDEPTQFPGCEGQRLVSLRGNGYLHFWVFDLATGEAVRFAVSPRLSYQLTEHQVQVCPLFEPFLDWLGQLIADCRRDWWWWDSVPRTVMLPNAPFAFSRARRGEYVIADYHDEDGTVVAPLYRHLPCGSVAPLWPTDGIGDCPRCGTTAKDEWRVLYYQPDGPPPLTYPEMHCAQCGKLHRSAANPLDTSVCLECFATTEPETR